MIRITLPDDEPYNPSIFVNPYWISLIFFIFLWSIMIIQNQDSQLTQNSILALILSISMLVY